MSRTPRRRFLVLASAALAGCRADGGAVAAQGTGGVLAGLRAARPRLLTTPTDLATLETRLAADEIGGRWRAALLREAERLLARAPVDYTLEPRRPVLLPTSREVLKRTETLGVAWLLTRDARYAMRLAAEMERVCAFDSWNPSHFLDVAEMTMAVALAHDWCHDVVTAKQRDTMATALIEKGLKPGLEQHRRRSFWTRATHNWNLVCNGGMAAGALSVADAEPALATEILDLSIASARRAFASYGPDGGWDEGASYWDYATQYAVFFVAALDSALGQDFGLSATPGFARAGDFRLHMEGPTGKLFNFADGGETTRATPALMWTARRFDRPIDAWIVGRQPTIAGTGVLWFHPGRSAPQALQLPLDAHFRHVEAASLRGAWNDRAATWIGFKAGDNAANHSNLDIGTFVLDAGGERFAIDLGADDYALPGYFDPKRRFGYYRLGTSGQNTLLIDGANQPATARAAIAGLRDDGGFARAVAEMTAAYPAARRVARGVALLHRRSAIVADEIVLEAGQGLRWQMHTRAEITLEGPRATLRQGAARVDVEILSPVSGALFAAEPAMRATPENPNAGIKRLFVDLPVAPGPSRLTVLVRVPGAPPAPALLARAAQPLARWLA
jgi:hypothetical protein